MLGEVIGMAASICAGENTYPRDVYETHLARLKAMMEKGVPAPVYHAYPCDASETYHFKEPGFISVNPPSRKLEDPDIKSRIEALKVQHKQ